MFLICSLIVFINCKLFLYNRDIGNFRLVGICLKREMIFFCVNIIGSLVCLWFEIKLSLYESGFFNILWYKNVSVFSVLVWVVRVIFLVLIKWDRNILIFLFFILDGCLLLLNWIKLMIYLL